MGLGEGATLMKLDYIEESRAIKTVSSLII